MTFLTFGTFWLKEKHWCRLSAAVVQLHIWILVIVGVIPAFDINQFGFLKFIFISNATVYLYCGGKVDEWPRTHFQMCQRMSEPDGAYKGNCFVSSFSLHLRPASISCLLDCLQFLPHRGSVCFYFYFRQPARLESETAFLTGIESNWLPFVFFRVLKRERTLRLWECAKKKSHDKWDQSKL